MNLKKIIPVIALLICAVAMSGCKQENKYRIGVSQCSEDDWRRKLNDEIMREVLLHDNIEVEIISADDNSEKQKADLRYFANGDFDVIIASPNEVDAVTPVLDSIYNAGIPLIIFDRRTNTGNCTAFQGADNKAIGRAAAQYAHSLVPSPQIIEIEGDLATSPAIDRHIGFAEYAQATPSITVLASAEGEWTTEGGKRIADSLLSIYPQANVIYTHNDRMGMGAAQVLDSLHRRDIKIIGIDATPEIGLKAVLDSVIDATFIYPSEGRNLIKTALAILEGEPYEKNYIIPTCTAVNTTNAEIMYVQNEALKEETNNIHELKSHINVYLKTQHAQRALLSAALVIVLLLAVLVFVILKNFWNQRRSRIEIERQSQEIKQQNEQLQEKNEEIRQMLTQVQQATQSKLSFFTNVSHDLRTPLTLIAEPVNQLQKADNLTESQHGLMDLAAKNVKILMRLINQILDLRKYENSMLSLNLSEVNLADEVRSWTEAFREAAAKRHLKYKVELPESAEGYDIAIDVDKVERVLYNLMANAFKFTPENGTVKVRLTRDDNNAYIIVADNGKGISAADIEKIFDRFFKTDEVNPHGSGIGLALSKAFAELHGGNITVESAEGKGAEFTVRLPIRHIEGQAATHNTEHKSAAEVSTELATISLSDEEPEEHSSTLLVIDDNADICALVASLMRGKFNVLQAHNGAQGVKLATKYVPDVIICDVMMPGIDGIETCRMLKAEVTTSHIPVLMLTACAMDEQRIAGYEGGADAYLTKPFNSDVLMAQVESLIANRKRLYDRFNSAAPAGNASTEAQPQLRPRDIDSDFYQRFTDVVNAEISNSSLSVDDIAAKLGISRVQLYRKMKALTNYSPTDLVRIQRLQRASSLLKTSEMTVSEICFAVGFTSHSYFTKCYHEYFGESPSDVQRRTSKPKI